MTREELGGARSGTKSRRCTAPLTRLPHRRTDFDRAATRKRDGQAPQYLR